MSYVNHINTYPLKNQYFKRSNCVVCLCTIIPQVFGDFVHLIRTPTQLRPHSGRNWIKVIKLTAKSTLRTALAREFSVISRASSIRWPLLILFIIASSSYSIIQAVRRFLHYCCPKVSYFLSPTPKSVSPFPGRMCVWVLMLVSF